METVDNILFFPNCIISEVKIQEEIFLVYIQDSESVFSLKKTEENFRKIVVQFQNQFDKKLEDEVIEVFEECFSDKKSNNHKPLSLYYLLIGFRHYKTLQYANFSDIQETDLVNTDIIYKDKYLRKALKKRYLELKKK